MKFPVSCNRVFNHAVLSALRCIVLLAIGGITAAGADTGSCDNDVVTKSAFESAVIGTVSISNGNIFDLSIPGEDRALFRLANALHVKTQPDTIRTQLLFETGDCYSQQTIDESERLLRSNRYIRDAEIVPKLRGDGMVDLDVETTDVWTLSPSISFGRGGGKNTGGIGIKEYNLLGRGIRIGVTYKSDIDRDATAFLFSTSNLLGSRITADTYLANNSDGNQRQLAFALPFFALTTEHAGGFSYDNGHRIDSYYDRGEVSGSYRHEFADHDAFLGWSNGLVGDWTTRYRIGLDYESHQFSAAGDLPLSNPDLPTDRRFLYPYLGVEMLQNRYVESRNVDQIGRVEDRFLGMRYAGRIGIARENMGSSENAVLFSAEYSNSLLDSSDGTLLVDAGVQGRVSRGAVHNFRFEISSRYDHRQSDNALFHAQVDAIVGHNLDRDEPLYLGGDNGLRGYPLRYQAGSRTALLTLEQRFFTNWYPFRLFRVGAAAFVDVGRTWGRHVGSGESLGWLRDAGFGLRLGNSRSGVGRVIHIDIAYPLDGEASISNLQLLVEAKKGF